jgi:basic amino acid/polyamine antiporter, APA family
MTEKTRTLGLLDTTFLVAGSMIGSGIFIVSADMMRDLMSPFWVLMCWLLSGVLTLFAALSYGELAGMMPKAGGQFIYLQKAFGNLTAFVYGWTVFMVIQTGVIAAVGVAFAKFCAVFFPFFNEANLVFEMGTFKISRGQLLGVASILFLTWINSRGVENGKWIQRLFTSAKLIALLGIISVAFLFSDGLGYLQANFSNPFAASHYDIQTGVISSLSGIGIACAIGTAMIGALFSSDAWNNVTFVAGEIKQPQRNIPLGLLIGVTIVTVLYCLANVAYFILLPALSSGAANDTLSQGIMLAQNDRVGTAALSVLFGKAAVYFMAALIIISTFGCNNGLILSGSRLFESMANEGLFFKQAAFLNKFNVPSKALWLQGFWASVLCLSGSYGDLLNYATFSSLLFYIVTIAALFWLRKKEPLAERPYKAFGYPIIPALYIIITAIICVNLMVAKPFNTSMGLVVIGVGVPIYFLFKKKDLV